MKFIVSTTALCRVSVEAEADNAPAAPRAATVRVEVSGPAVVTLTCGGAQ